MADVRVQSLLAPLLLLPRGVKVASDVFIAFVDGSEISRTRGAVRVRRVAAALLIGTAVVFSAQKLAGGSPPAVTEVLLMLLGASLLGNLSARFLRDWGLVVVGVIAYGVTVRLVPQLDLPVHYEPQIAFDELIGFGTAPTVWLQEHLYSGKTGPVELFALALYLSHFIAPLALGFYLWFRRLNRPFGELMFGLLAVSLLADVMFMLAPTAPPWLAAQQGYLPPVHHILKSGLTDVGFDGLAALIGDSTRYNVVAAVPSLHAAFPVVALLVVRAHGLPSWLVRAQWAQMLGVFFAIVYTGDHYVVDAVAGAVFAAVAWLAVRRALAAAAAAGARRRLQAHAQVDRLYPAPEPAR